MWLQKNGERYEYIGVYVDDLAMAAVDPDSITQTLETNYKLHLKGVGPIAFHLGCDDYRDKDGTLSYAPKSYIEKMLVMKGYLVKNQKNTFPHWKRMNTPNWMNHIY
jgi:hypothetical protein